MSAIDPHGVISYGARWETPRMDAPTWDDSAEVLEPALITRTSSELLGRRPLPRVLRERPVLFVLGPPGVGKTAVARRVLSEMPGTVEASFQNAVVAAVRAGWSRQLREAPGLLFDDVDCLHERHGPQDLLRSLVRERALAGRRTVLCQGHDADHSVTLLFEKIPLALRASLLVRFPVGRGRRRHVAARCADRGLPFSLAREAVVMEPWSYELVERFLDGVQRTVATGA